MTASRAALERLCADFLGDPEVTQDNLLEILVEVAPETNTDQAGEWSTRELADAIARHLRLCRRCGCTEDTACEDALGQPCSWIAIDVCSACVGKVDDDE